MLTPVQQPDTSVIGQIQTGLIEMLTALRPYPEAAQVRNHLRRALDAGKRLAHGQQPERVPEAVVIEGAVIL